MEQNHKDLNAKDIDMATINEKKKRNKKMSTKKRRNGEIVCKDLKKQRRQSLTMK